MSSPNSPRVYEGTSRDTKPTPVPDGTLFDETDTGWRWRYSNSSATWEQTQWRFVTLPERQAINNELTREVSQCRLLLTEIRDRLMMG